VNITIAKSDKLQQAVRWIDIDMTTFIQILEIIGHILAAAGATTAAIMAIINRNKLSAIHVDLNSRLTALLAASVDSGRIAERSDNREAAAVVANEHIVASANEHIVASANEHNNLQKR
jgi:hypothetical protein